MGQPSTIGNSRLIEYGIRQEGSSLRAHVSVVSRRVYAFSTAAGVAAIESHDYDQGRAYQGDIETGVGFLVPPKDIVGLQEVWIPVMILAAARFNLKDCTTVKGQKAVGVVFALLQGGLFPLYPTLTPISDARMQIQGIDIVVDAVQRIQVKLDWKAGPGGVLHPGTGFLFIQTHECNPYHLH